jgi:hypothetical protein
MRVAEARERLPLLAKAAAGRLVSQQTRRQHLQGHVAVQLLVVGAIHLAHAPGAESLLDAVVGERASDHADLPSVLSREQTSTAVTGAARKPVFADTRYPCILMW